MAYVLRVDEGTRKALEAIAAAKAMQPPEGPVVLSEEYLRLIERAERLPENRPGTNKAWTERVLAEWDHLVKNAKIIRRG